MKAIILTIITIIFPFSVFASQNIIFGAICTIDPQLMEKKLKPFMHEIEKATGKKLIFKTGYNYADTIEKFADGTFDIGYIGPIPYIKAQRINPDSLKILAGIKNSKDKPFRSVIISKKGSRFKRYQDLRGQNFAFGSPNSTLSYYVPRYMLEQKHIMQKLKNYHFLGRHDKVAQYVIMGKFAAGAIKQSIANKYSKYIQVIDQSKSMPGFIIVANKKLDEKTTQQIQELLLNFKNISAIKKLKKSAVGFEARYDKDYNDLRDMMKKVESYK